MLEIKYYVLFFFNIFLYFKLLPRLSVVMLIALLDSQ